MHNSCLVTGATSQIGTWLVPELLKAGWDVHLVSRSSRRGDVNGGHLHTVDLADMTVPIPLTSATVLFSTTSIALLPPRLKEYADLGITRLIAFSSTSRFTKTDSDDPVDQQLSRSLADSERHVAEKCMELNIRWTIFRPTLVYNGKLGDRNVHDIARLIKRLGFFPMVGRGAGLRQPVHASDLATACMLAVGNRAAYDKSYNLAGAEVLSYRDMVKRIFDSMKRTPRFITLPVSVFALAVVLARRHPRLKHLRTSMATRMEKDMIFSFEEAAMDFGYAPRFFTPDLSAVVQ